MTKSNIKIFNIQYLIFLILFLVSCSLFFAAPVSAVEAINIHLRIEGPDQTILNTTLDLPAECQAIDATTTTPHTFSGNRAICALEQAKSNGLIAAYQVTDWGFGFSLDSINDLANAPDWSQTWIIRVNQQTAATGIDGVELLNNDELLLTFGPWPMEPLQIIQPATTTLVMGETLNLAVQVWNDASLQFEPFQSAATFWLNNVSSTAASGTLNWSPQTAGAYQVWAEAEGKTRSAPLLLTAASSTLENLISVNLNLRYQNQFIFQDTVNLTSSTIFSYTDISDNSTASTSTGPNVLASLLVADATSTAFNISDLKYYPAFDSFYLNCLTFTAPTSTEACANWNYVVDGVYPSFGMDSYALSGGEAIYVYYGNPWQITASTSSFPVQTTTTLATWRYNYDSTSAEWLADPGDIIDISVPNPNPTGWWDATITTTTLTTSASGTVDYAFSATGTYYAKITSLDFSKWSSAITLTVTSPADQEDQGDEGDDDGGGNGPTGGATADIISSNLIQEKTRLLLNFLASQQADGGKIIDGGVTDWAIISFGANNQYAEDIKKGANSLLDFAKSYNFTDASDLNLCAGYPRHLLALLAAGLPKENPEILNLKSKINSECHQNHLYGQNGINDDVFALLALLSADTPISEPIITDIISTLTQDQTAEGAFTWAGFASPDITGAAVNCLRYAQNKGATIDQNIFAKAKTYLKAQQLSDGGWGFGQSDALTTSWVMMGTNSLSEGQTDWTNSAGKNPWSVLINQLNSDGYYEPSWAPGTIDWFGTKHAAPALLGKSWPIILTPKPSPPAVNNSIGGVGGVASSPTAAPSTPSASATSTIPLETPLSTSTLAIPETAEISEVVNLPNPNQNEPTPLNLSHQEASPSSAVSGTSGGNVSQTTAPVPARPIFAPAPPPPQLLPATIADLPPTFLNPNLLPAGEQIQPPVNPPLPLEKKAATATVASSAILLSATSLFLLIRLLLMAV